AGAPAGGRAGRAVRRRRHRVYVRLSHSVEGRPMATVLVIGDDPAVRASCRSALHFGGYGVREAADGLEGFIAFQGEPAGVVLGDLQMPVWDGLQTITELRRACPGVKVVAMSGSKSLLAAESLGAAALTKPFGYVELMDAVELALGPSARGQG